MATVNYHEYIASREWALKKNAVRERSGGICERCRKNPHTQTHHLTYERLGDERLEDLLGTCRPCHEYLSGRSDFDPASPEFADCRTLADIFRSWGARLPRNIEAFDAFNQHIQIAISFSNDENAALELSQIKLEVNRRLLGNLKTLKSFAEG